MLPTGARTREEVEALLSLDWIERVDEDWPRYLARTVSEFVLATSDPPGVIDANAAGWLVTASAEANSNTASTIVRTIASRAYLVDGALSALVRRWAKRCSIAVAQGSGRGGSVLPPEFWANCRFHSRGKSGAKCRSGDAYAEQPVIALTIP
jgi:hypothetical protein